MFVFIVVRETFPVRKQYIMNKIILMGICSLPLLAGCQQNETERELSATEMMSLQASVSNLSLSRTVTDAADAATTFEAGDEIGFFMPEEDAPVKWTLTGDGWQSETPLVWEDKVNEFEFCAYYPYSEESAVRTAIPMPDLSAQTGEFSALGEFDFLAARCTSGYKTNSGAVSFTGAYAFRHVYSLLSITVKKDRAEENVSISKAVLKGSGLFSRTSYRFGETSEADGIVAAADASPADELSLAYDVPAEVASETGYSLTLLCNPSVLEENSEFSISYMRDGISYTATTDKLGKEFQAGTYNKYTLKLTKEGLVLIGQEIVGWNEEVIPDIAFEETPVE